VILVRRALPFLAACLALFVVGCSLLPAPLEGAPTAPPAALPADLAARRDAWLRLGPVDYTWVIQMGCECGLNGEYTIWAGARRLGHFPAVLERPRDRRTAVRAVEGAGAVDAKSAPTAPWKTHRPRFPQLPQPSV